MFCTFECDNALLVLFELTAVSPDDLQELDYVLIRVRLGVGICALDLAFQIRRALAQDEGVCALLVFFKEGLPLLCLGDILLPQKHFSRVDGIAGRGRRWIRGDHDRGQTHVPDCLRDLRPPFVLLLDVVRDRVHRFLILGRIFCVANVKGVGFEPHHLRDKLSPRGRSAPRGPSSWMLPFDFGLRVRHVLQLRRPARSARF